MYFNADIDECENGEDNCHENANCTNIEGSFACSCTPGYTGDGVNCTSELATLHNLHIQYVVKLLSCMNFIIADINECELETYPCSSNANCTDTDGSFNCTCREGFEGDGFNCTGIICIPCKHFYRFYDDFILCCRHFRVRKRIA